MTDHAAQDRVYHEAIGSEYHAVIVDPRAAMNDLLFAPIEAYLPAGGAMLDVGCGTGHMLLRFGARYDRRIGVDHSAAMLASARARLRASGLADTVLIEADVLATLDAAAPPAPIERQALGAGFGALGGPFALVTCVGFLHHLSTADQSRVLAALARLTAADGLLVVAEPIEADSAEPPSVAAWNRAMAPRVPTYSRSVEEPDEAPLRREELLASLAQADWTPVVSEQSWELLSPPDLAAAEREALKRLYGAQRGSGYVFALAARRGKTASP